MILLLSVLYLHCCELIAFRAKFNCLILFPCFLSFNIVHSEIPYSSVSCYVDTSYLTFIAIQLTCCHVIWDLCVWNLVTDCKQFYVYIYINVENKKRSGGLRLRRPYSNQFRFVKCAEFCSRNNANISNYS